MTEDSDHDFKQYFDYYDDEEDEKEEIDLDDIDYATKASYGAAQETTIGGNIFRMAKAAVLAGTSDKSWSETLDEMEKERQAEIDEQFPLLANLKESEEDLAILSGRLGVAVADPVTFAMPWLKVAKAGSVGARVAKTAALGAGVSVGDTALREKVVYGEVSPTSLGIAATVGGASSVLGLGVQQGINFVQRKRTVANALKDVEPEDVAKTNVTIDASTAKPVEDAVNTAADEVGFNAAEVGAKNSFLPEYLAATEAIKKERAELNKLIKETKDEVALTDLKAKRSSLSSKQTALNKKIKQETIGLIDQKNEVNIRALELLAENESFSTKAARAIMSEATKPLIGATGGFIHGAGFREDAQDVETLYVSMAIGAGLGAAWKRIDASDAITSINKEADKKVKNLEREKEKLEEYCRQMMEKLNSTAIKTNSGTIMSQEKIRYSTSNWEEFYRLVLDLNRPELFEKRIHQTNFKEFLEENPDKEPKGLNIFRETKITVRRS